MTDKDKKSLHFADSKYRLILIAARRSKQIQKGDSPRLVSNSHKPTRVALEEAYKGLIPFEILPPRKAKEIEVEF